MLAAHAAGWPSSMQAVPQPSRVVPSSMRVVSQRAAGVRTKPAASRLNHFDFGRVCCSDEQKLPSSSPNVARAQTECVDTSQRGCRAYHNPPGSSFSGIVFGQGTNQAKSERERTNPRLQLNRRPNNTLGIERGSKSCDGIDHEDVARSFPDPRNWLHRNRNFNRNMVFAREPMLDMELGRTSISRRSYSMHARGEGPAPRVAVRM